MLVRTTSQCRRVDRSSGRSGPVTGAGPFAELHSGWRPSEYAVEITLPAAGVPVVLQDGNLKEIMTVTLAKAVWSIRLPRGIYKVIAGPWERLFAVTGPGTGAGGAIHVA